MNTFKKGETVMVRDFRGRKFLRKVWNDGGNVVFITSASNYEALCQGVSAILPMGTPKETVSTALDGP